MIINIRTKWIKRVTLYILRLIVFVNILAYFHAYTFTHFSSPDNFSESKKKKMDWKQKIQGLFFGFSKPKPVNTITPKRSYETIYLQSNKKIECWKIALPSPKGTIILFHGYGGKKSDMLEQAEIFNQLGYQTLLVDFMGSGGSEGSQTTIGFHEAQQVVTAFGFSKTTQNLPIYLYGNSMGAAAIMRALSEWDIKPEGIILECPFGRMKKTVEARFEIVGIPSFPLASVLMFWGGVQNDFSFFDHNPEEYAKKIESPTLLMYGEKDNRVSQEETNTIFKNLKGKKKKHLFPKAGHENYLHKYKDEWRVEVEKFLDNTVHSEADIDLK
jgi:alpha-beta hydrolase superfamily lysophospholipase